MRQIVKPRTRISVWAGQCHKYVRKAFGAPAMWGSAWEAWEHAKYRHTGSPPSGVAVPLWFSHYGTYGKPAQYKNWGHTVISMGDGTYWSSPGRGYGRKKFTSISAIESYFNCRYVGWTEDVNRVRVVEPGSNDLPTIPDNQDQEEDQPMRGIYYSENGVAYCAIIHPVSGLFSEYNSGSSKYNSGVAKGLGTGSYAKVTKSHYQALKRDFAAIRVGKE